MDVLQDTCGVRGVPALLLLVSLCVGKAAAICSQPHIMENVVMSNEALLLNTYPEGTKVTLQCANGYLYNSGSGTLTCVDDQWTPSDLQCKKKDCGVPRPQPNMSFNISAGTLFGDVVKVNCDRGYQISGSSYKRCYATGWSGRSKCEIVTCEKPPEVANGRSSWDAHDDPKYGEEILYSCDVGFTLSGSGSITCTESGEYDSGPPRCSGVTADDRLTSPTSSVKEASPSPDRSVTSTAHRDRHVTATSAPTFPPSRREVDEDILQPKNKVTSSILEPTAPTSLQEKPDDVKPNKDTDYIPVILGVIGVTLVVCILAVIVHKFLLRRKGSYDTREDLLKPELLQFQNL